VNQRLRIEEGGEPDPSLTGRRRLWPWTPPPAGGLAAERLLALRAFPRSGFRPPRPAGRQPLPARSEGASAVLLFWTTEAPPSRAALDALAAGSDALAQAASGGRHRRRPLGGPPEGPRRGLRRRDRSGGRREPEVALGYAILNRHLFMNHQDLQLPTTYLLDAGAGRQGLPRRVDVPLILQDAPRIEAPPVERLARALPFEGILYAAPGPRDYVPYGRTCSTRGWRRRRSSPSSRRRRGSRARRSSTAWGASS